MQRYPYAYLVAAKGEAASQYIYTSITDDEQDTPSIIYVYVVIVSVYLSASVVSFTSHATPLHTRDIKHIIWLM